MNRLLDVPRLARPAELLRVDVATPRPSGCIRQDPLNSFIVVNRVGFVPRSKVENSTRSAPPGHPATKHFTSGKPADEDQFIGSRHVEHFSIHFRLW